MSLALLGVAIGLAGAFADAPYDQPDYGVSATDSPTYACRRIVDAGGVHGLLDTGAARQSIRWWH